MSFEETVRREWSTTATILTLGAAMASLGASSGSRPQERGGGPQGVTRLSDAIQVRLDLDTRRRLDEIVLFAKQRSDRRVTRSALIRWAVEEYAGALVARLEDDLSTASAVFTVPASTSDTDHGEAVRVRLSPATLAQLDCVEAYARGIGRREATRSALTRAAIAAFISGFNAEMAAHADGDSDSSARRSGSNRS